MDYYLMGKRIREERVKLGYTQEKLAEKAGISTNFLACIEGGIRRGSFETYVKLVNVLETTLDNITRDFIDAAKTNVLKNELIRYFDMFDETEQEIVVGLVKSYQNHKKNRSK